jgi:hypothetical protein
LARIISKAWLTKSINSLNVKSAFGAGGRPLADGKGAAVDPNGALVIANGTPVAPKGALVLPFPEGTPEEGRGGREEFEGGLVECIGNN